MNNASKRDCLPPLVADILHDPVTYIDNLFADGWKRLRFNSIISKAGFRKRSGVDISEVVYLLLIWKWLNVSSISVFAQKALGLFSHAKKDVLYDLLKREDINWREFNLEAAKRVYKEHKLEHQKMRTFVFDDSIKARRGKRMEGVSSHFDHVSGTYVMGEQVLTLGLATDEAFLPVDSQISISDSGAQELIGEYKDQRSVGAKRYQEAIGKTKVEMAEDMLRRAVRSGIKAEFVVADAWFGNRAMIRTTLDLGMDAILRMKKNKLKYRVVIDGRTQSLDAAEIYQSVVRKQWKKVRGMPWKAVDITVEVDVAPDRKKSTPRDFRTVKLLFVRGVNESEDATASKKDWALFLSTDTKMATSRILEVYALRWSIEVYFKEAKQHLGFLKEQTITFVSHIASIHLCAIRYLMLVDGKLRATDASIGELRSRIQNQLDSLNFAAHLWQIFRAIVSGTLASLGEKLGCTVDEIMEKIDDQVTEFFIRSLQLDPKTMRLEFE